MDERSWEDLLRSAFAILDSVHDPALASAEVIMGGGTVLMMRLRHRLSRDIDLFLHDAQWLARLTPRLNNRIAAVALDYSEQANSVKLVLSQGDIDFAPLGDFAKLIPTMVGCAEALIESAGRGTARNT
jgi:hypothetical protein